MTDKTTPDAPEEHDGRATGGSGADGSTENMAAAFEDAVAAASRPESRPKQPLITAIEIENFKGIGAPVRIDLRPITLLFGRNSAGKSTILQALCYAHEILSHRNVDTHKTELGGDQIDLGGFRQFVHKHDLDRVARLRFELNLENWTIPESLHDQLSSLIDPDWTEMNSWLFRDPSTTPRSGWLELAVGRRRFGQEPELTNYEVGIDKALVARINRDESHAVSLSFNWTHPVFNPIDGGRPAPSAAAGHVREAPGPPNDDQRIYRATLHGDQKSPLPHWDRLLDLVIDSQHDWELGGVIGGPHHFEFNALLSVLLVGIGITLRDELKKLRYLGPVRELHPDTATEPDPHHQDNWNDGSAAWNRLAGHKPDVAFLEGDLLDDVNNWLSRNDRFDAGYILRRQSTIELPADAPPVSQIRRYESVFRTYRDEQGVIDLDKRVRELAAILIRIGGHSRQGAERQARSMIQEDANLVSVIGKLESGDPPSAVKALVRAIAEAPQRTTLQLLTADTELPVRTSDIGVGVSQILPVVVAALDPDRPGITAIEQPELHVHPKMQVELGDLFAQGVGQGGIFLIETHSEHLILRLLRRIEETYSGELKEGNPSLRPDQVSVVFLEQTDGEVRATRLRIDESGEFRDRWPQGFFEERSDELF